MIRTIYEIKIKCKTDVVFIKKYYTKTDGTKHYNKIRKVKKNRKFPEIILSQINYNDVGEHVCTDIVRERCINIAKNDLETVKKILSE